jgi:omega-6 fatty acid desaturase (delta-12 desaturase)
MGEISPVKEPQSWQSVVANYNRPRLSQSTWQVINSIVPYILLWILMIQALKVSIWLTLPLILLAAGFLIRIFIIFHDCGHGSFFKSRKANVIVGKICGILAFTPYHRWTDSHRTHHQTVGNLDKRGFGDVWTLTVDEYIALSPSKRFIYRLFRHPLFLFGFGGPMSFILTNRFTTKIMTRKQKLNIYLTNVVMLVLAAGVSWLIGWQVFLLIQLPVIYIAAIAGTYLFYLQHQYDDVIWRRNEDWDYFEMALHGSSFFKLPSILRWFTGNIGFHHIHHLGSTIPNYNLAKCHRENPMFQEVKPITFIRSFHSLKLRLWDEKNQQIISFRQMRKLAANNT